jgi:hypothetical protein
MAYGFQQKYIWLSKVIREPVEATPLHSHLLAGRSTFYSLSKSNALVHGQCRQLFGLRYDLCDQKAPIIRGPTNNRLITHRTDIVMKKFSTTFLAIPIALCFTASVRADFPTALDRDAESRLVTAPPARTMSKAPQLSGKPQTDKDETEAGTSDTPGFLFLIGVGLIGLRLLVSYQRKKVKRPTLISDSQSTV